MHRSSFDREFDRALESFDDMFADMEKMMSEIDRGFPLPRSGKMRGSYSSTVIVNGKVVSHEEGTYDNAKDPEVITVTAKKGDAPPVVAEVPRKELEAEEAKGGSIFDRMERLMTRIFNAVRGKSSAPEVPAPEVKTELPAPEVKAEAPKPVPMPEVKAEEPVKELPAPKPVLMLPAPAPEEKKAPEAVVVAIDPANDEKPTGPDKKIRNFKI